MTTRQLEGLNSAKQSMRRRVYPSRSIRMLRSATGTLTEERETFSNCAKTHASALNACLTCKMPVRKNTRLNAIECKKIKYLTYWSLTLNQRSSQVRSLHGHQSLEFLNTFGSFVANLGSVPNLHRYANSTLKFRFCAQQTDALNR